MKSVYLVRHAKSGWTDSSLSDFDRPLSERGKGDIKKIADFLIKSNHIADAYYSSPAKRAMKTAKGIVKGLGLKPKVIIEVPALYNFTEYTPGLEVIWAQANENESVMIFSHNNSITALANYLSENAVEELVTLGTVRFDFEVDSWDQIQESSGKINFYVYPKMFD